MHPVERRFIAYPGLIIPVRDVRTRIVALRVRKDEGAPRYSFVSSASVEPGPGPGAPAHVPVIRPTAGDEEGHDTRRCDRVPPHGPRHRGGT